MKTILAIDGGGVRGVVPATVLARLEQIVGGPCAGMFDLIAGTSTGGIIACGLGARIPAAQLAVMYKERGAEIFAKHWYRALPALMPKYSAGGIEKVLNDVFRTALFKNASTKLLVPSFDTRLGEPFHFKSWMTPCPWFMAEVARATSAAPTYFPSAKGYMVDGGLFANNPSMNAYAEARSLWPGEALLMLSLGTGYRTGHTDYPASGGFLQWAKPLVSAIFNAPAADVNYMADACMGAQFVRISGELSAGIDAEMDNASPANLAALADFGEMLATKIPSSVVQALHK